MSENYDAEQAEIERLTNEYNRLVVVKNKLVDEYNRLVVDLEETVNATVDSINRAGQLEGNVVPLLLVAEERVDEIVEITSRIEKVIQELSNVYFVIKNTSTASKKLTQLNEEYQSKFKIYNTLRRITLGYIIGLDKSLINNDNARKIVEKNYLANSEYWVSYCAMAVTLWVSDEQEAAERAIEKALEINKLKSSLFFLLINLRFKRQEAAREWFKVYNSYVDVNNIGDEWQCMLQAYLYRLFGNDPGFEKEVKEFFHKQLQEIATYNSSYGAPVSNRVYEYAINYAHKTESSFPLMKETVAEYPDLISALESAEKNTEFIRYYLDISESEGVLSADFLKRTEDVLYDLVNSFDEDEMLIVKEQHRNEMIMKTNGDLNAANNMYKNLYERSEKQTLESLLVDLALSEHKQNVDMKVKKFAISFLIDHIKEGYLKFRTEYNSKVKETLNINIDGCALQTEESEQNNAKNELNKYYAKNKTKFILKDKIVKLLIVLLAFSIIGLGSSVALVIAAGAWSSLKLVAFIIFIVATISIAFFLFFMRIPKRVKIINEKRKKSIEKFNNVFNEIRQWKSEYFIADEYFNELLQTLEYFDD